MEVFTGRNGDWKLSVPKIADFPKQVALEVGLFNEQGKTLGRRQITLTGQTEMVFPGVNADDIEGTLTTRIISIDGIEGETAAENGYITIYTAASYREYIRNLPPIVPDRDIITYRSWVTVKNWAEQHGYKFSGREEPENGEKLLGINLAEDVPATGISLNDAYVWCNAFNEYTGTKGHYRKKLPITTIVTSSALVIGGTGVGAVFLPVGLPIAFGGLGWLLASRFTDLFTLHNAMAYKNANTKIGKSTRIYKGSGIRVWEITDAGEVYLTIWDPNAKNNVSRNTGESE
ncbi:hypothetical protein AGMMS49944_22860 [Spirochaetia bacterium]|nr:hypothetical protein AGMMS49944_22860 [Spirochaetia bacterium]